MRRAIYLAAAAGGAIALLLGVYFLGTTRAAAISRATASTAAVVPVERYISPFVAPPDKYDRIAGMDADKCSGSKSQVDDCEMYRYGDKVGRVLRIARERLRAHDFPSARQYAKYVASAIQTSGIGSKWTSAAFQSIAEVTIAKSYAGQNDAEDAALWAGYASASAESVLHDPDADSESRKYAKQADDEAKSLVVSLSSE